MNKPKNSVIGCCFTYNNKNKLHYKNNKVTIPNVTGSSFRVLLRIMSEFSSTIQVRFKELNIT